VLIRLVYAGCIWPTISGLAYKETDSGALGSASSAGDQCAEGENHGQALADGADEVQLSAANTLHEIPRRGGEKSVDDLVDTA